MEKLGSEPGEKSERVIDGRALLFYYIFSKVIPIFKLLGRNLPPVIP